MTERSLFLSKERIKKERRKKGVRRVSILKERRKNKFSPISKSISMTDIIFRGVKSDDLKELKDLHTECFPIQYDDIFFENICNGKGFKNSELFSEVAIEVESSRMVGCILGQFVKTKKCQDGYFFSEFEDPAKEIFYILTLGLREDYRRSGLGTKLLKSCLNYAKINTKCGAIYLHVIHYNQGAVRFYEKNGFNFFREIEEFYQIDDIHYSAYLYIFYLNGYNPPIFTRLIQKAKKVSSLGFNFLFSWISCIVPIISKLKFYDKILHSNNNENKGINNNIRDVKDSKNNKIIENTSLSSNDQNIENNKNDGNKKSNIGNDKKSRERYRGKNNNQNTGMNNHNINDINNSEAGINTSEISIPNYCLSTVNSSSSSSKNIDHDINLNLNLNENMNLNMNLNTTLNSSTEIKTEIEINTDEETTMSFNLETRKKNSQKTNPKNVISNGKIISEKINTEKKDFTKINSSTISISKHQICYDCKSENKEKESFNHLFVDLKDFGNVIMS